MDYLVGKILERPIHSLAHDISSFLTRDNQRIAVIGALALACLAACYLLYRSCCFQKAVSELGQSPDPKSEKVARATQEPVKPATVENVAVESKLEKTKTNPTLDKSAVDVEETDRAHLLKQALQDNLELQEDYRALEQKAKLLILEIDNLETKNRTLQDTCEDQSRKIDQLVADLRQEKDLSFRQESELLKLRSTIDKLQAVMKVVPEVSSIPTKPMRYVFVYEDGSDSDSSTEDVKHAFKNFVAQAGVAQCEFLPLSAATVKRRKLQKELDEGTVNLFSVSFISDFSSSKNYKHMKAMDALFDPNKTMVVFLVRFDLKDDDSKIKALMPATIYAESSEGTKLSRLIALPIMYDSQTKKQILHDSASLNKLKAKAELFHELHEA